MNIQIKYRTKYFGSFVAFTVHFFSCHSFTRYNDTLTDEAILCFRSQLSPLVSEISGTCLHPSTHHLAVGWILQAQVQPAARLC
jgi:hypothetical protein